jgi:hypothetical protein
VSELERALAGLELQYPPTPGLAPAVRARLEGAPAPARPLVLRPRRTLAIALAALLLLAGTAVAAVPSLRHSVLDWLGLRSVKVERVPRLPATPTGDLFALGERTTLPKAATQASFTPVVPAGLRPDQVYFAEGPPGGQLALVYKPRPGLPAAGTSGLGMLITEFRGEQQSVFIQKALGPGTTAERVTVAGGRGLWIAGEPHILLYRDRNGEVQGYTPRLATNTLLWRRGELLLRLEAHISKAEALRIAGSMG